MANRFDSLEMGVSGVMLCILLKPEPWPLIGLRPLGRFIERSCLAGLFPLGIPRHSCHGSHQAITQPAH